SGLSNSSTSAAMILATSTEQEVGVYLIQLPTFLNHNTMPQSNFGKNETQLAEPQMSQLKPKRRLGFLWFTILGITRE
ncbi:hypothetical protein VIGAN_09179100, partial [Vigna angularis var. angularis]